MPYGRKIFAPGRNSAPTPNRCCARVEREKDDFGAVVFGGLGDAVAAAKDLQHSL
jgi:hypothetical protein